MDTHYQQLCELLFKAQTDSNQLLSLEQSINQAVLSNETNNIFTMLTRVIIDDASPCKYIAALVLKNTLRNHLATIPATELAFVKETLMLVLL